MVAKTKSDPLKPSAPIHRQTSHKKESVKAIDLKEKEPLSRQKSKTLAVEYAIGKNLFQYSMLSA